MRWPRFRRRPRRTIPGSGDFTQDIDKFLPGNRITLLHEGGETYRAMWKAMDLARRTIHLETYILMSDQSGREFGRRLMAKAREGVSVRVIFDSFGSLSADPSYLMQLRNAGVRMLEYHPVAPWRPRWAWGRRDHRKILVVDSRQAFAGGVNISDEHAPIDEGGEGWHDCHVAVEGPAAYELDRLFRTVWFKESRQWITLADYPESLCGNSLVWVAANHEFLHRHRIRRAYLNALRAARREVCLTNAYFLPDRGIRRALIAAARRGVEVKVLVQGLSDAPSVWRAGRHFYDQLLSSGVRLFEWPGPMLHAKTGVADGLWCTVGSYNMDHRSLRHNLEVNLHILDHELAAQMRARFERDLSRAKELKLEEWRRRPWTHKLGERFWSRFRYFF